MPNTTVYTNNQYYQDIATAIRNKNGTNTRYKPREMAPAIDSLLVSGETISLQNKTVTPTTSAQTITKDAGYHGLGTVTVNAIQTEVQTITENGVYTPSTGKFFSSITVSVAGEVLPDGDLLAYGNVATDMAGAGSADYMLLNS